MSGVIKGVGKVFKATVIAPMKYANKTTHQVVNYIKKSPILEAIVIAVAAYFTMGAALAYFGAAGAAAGGVTADAAGTAFGGLSITADAATVGGVAASGSALGAGVIGADAAAVGAAAGTSMAAYSGAAMTAAVEAGGGSAGAAASSGAAVGVGTSVPTSTALGSVANSAGTVAASNGALTVTNLAATTVVPDAADLAAASTSTFGGATLAGDAAAVGAGSYGVLGSSNATGQDMTPVSPSDMADAATPPQQPGLIQRGENWIKGIFSPSAPATAGTGPVVAPGPASSSFLGDTGKMMLLQGGLQVASSLLNKPQAQMSYAGVNEKGDGPGIGIHTINGGFGLATGGDPAAAPTGVPAALRPGGISPNSGAALSNAAVKSGQPAAAGNLGQTVANTVGVGGLVPQGAVNYMGGHS